MMGEGDIYMEQVNKKIKRPTFKVVFPFEMYAVYMEKLLFYINILKQILCLT